MILAYYPIANICESLGITWISGIAGAVVMRKFSKLATTATGSIVCMSIVANAVQAATLTVVTGEVFLSRGQGYEAVSGQTKLEPTDCLLVNPGGSAQIAYDDGAVLQLGPGSTTCVGSSATDAGGQGASDLVTGSTNGDTITGSAAAAPAGAGSDPNYLMWGIVGIAGIGGIIAIAGSGGGNNDNTNNNSGGNQNNPPPSSP